MRGLRLGVAFRSMTTWSRATRTSWRSATVSSIGEPVPALSRPCGTCAAHWRMDWWPSPARSEEHTSELPSLMRTSYTVFCLKKNQNESPKKTCKYKSCKYKYDNEY